MIPIVSYVAALQLFNSYWSSETVVTLLASFVFMPHQPKSSVKGAMKHLPRTRRVFEILLLFASFYDIRRPALINFKLKVKSQLSDVLPPSPIAETLRT